MKTHILKPILIAIVCLLATPSFFGMDQHAAKRRRCEYFQNTCKLASLTRTLHRAAKQGDIELTRRCLASPLQPHPAAKANLIHKWQTPLHRAASGGHIAIVNWLLDAGAYEDAINGASQTPLHLAVMKEHKEVVQDLLKNHANPNIADAQGNTPLHLAANQCSEPFAIAPLLLAHGARVNATNNNGRTPLHIAVEAPNRKLVNILLNAGANVHARNINGRTPMLDTGDGWAVRRLVEAGADPNAADHRGLTRLHLGAQEEEDDVVEELLAQDANPDITDQNWQTPLHYAAMYLYNPSDTTVVDALINAGADVDAVDKNVQTPLHLAIPNYTPELSADVASKLIEGGASPNIRNADGKTPLQIAATYGITDDPDYTELVRIMLASNHPIDDLEQPIPHQSYWND